LTFAFPEAPEKREEYSGTLREGFLGILPLYHIPSIGSINSQFDLWGQDISFGLQYPSSDSTSLNLI
jgi:hypothetical protein